MRNRKRLLSLLLAVVLMLGMFPTALAANGDQTDELIRLTWDNISWGPTEDADGVDRVYTSEEDDGGILIADEDGYDYCNAIVVYLAEDSSVHEADFIVTLPDDLAEEPDLMVRAYRHRPGDHEGDTIEEFEDTAVEDGLYTITLSEYESPWVYGFEFGILDDDEWVKLTYEYAFELRVQRYGCLQWDCVSYEIESGELEDEYRWPSTDDLMILEPDGAIGPDNYTNWLELYITSTDPDVSAKVKFTVTCPEWMLGEEGLAANVCFSSYQELMELTDGSVSIEVAENSFDSMDIQFGILEDEEFIPLTYIHPFAFRVNRLERLTWDDVDVTAADGELEDVFKFPGEDEPLRTEQATDSSMNWVDAYILPGSNAAAPAVNFTVKAPETLRGEEDLWVQYLQFDRGEQEDVSSRRVYSQVDSYSVTIPAENEQVYTFTFGVKDDNDNFIPRTYTYHFGVDIHVIEKLTWDNIEVILPEGMDDSDVEITKMPATGDLYDTEEEHANALTVENVPAGSQVGFKITCPETDKRDVYAWYVPFIKGLQSNPDVEIQEIQLDEDGSFTVYVDVIGAADITRVIHALGFMSEEEGRVTDIYHFDFIARASGTVVNAGRDTQQDGVLSATVQDGVISAAISQTPDEMVCINANDYNEDAGIVETSVRLGSTDVNALVDNEVDLQIATPVGTVTLPSEAIAQAKGDAEDASVIMEVKATDPEKITYQNISVNAYKSVEVTLFRVVGDNEPEEVPIRMSGASAVTVTVVLMEGLTLNEPLYLVYLPENGRPVIEQTIPADVVDTNSCVTFTTSHLSEFALLSYADAQALTNAGTTHSSSSGGSSSSASAGKVGLETGRNGKVEISPKNPSSGSRVTLTVTPDPGYVLSSIRVTDKNGDEVRLTEAGENRYTFTMPSGDVTVTTRFTAEESAPEETVTPALSFRDVDTSEWYAAAVAFVAENGMMAGNNGYFSPDIPLSRAMVAQVLYNMEGAPAAAASRNFPDVAVSDWFSDAVAWAVSQGCMSGYGSGSFGPNDPITREQLAAVFYGYCRMKGYDVTASDSLQSFTDSAAVSDWAETSVRWAVSAGLISGKSGGRLDPSGTASRAETAQILMNFSRSFAN